MTKQCPRKHKHKTDRNDEGNPMDFNQNEIQSEDRNIKKESR